MTNATTDNRTPGAAASKPRAKAGFWLCAAGIAVVLHGVLLVGVLPLFKSEQAFSKEQEQQRTEEVKARLAQLEEQRQRRREQTVLNPADAEKVRRLEEEKRKPELVEQVRHLEEIRGELQRRADQAVQRLKDQPIDQRMQVERDNVHAALTNVERRVRELLDSHLGQLIFGTDTKGWRRSPMSLDDLRVYRAVLTPEHLNDPGQLPGVEEGHHWRILRSEVETFADRTGGKPALPSEGVKVLSHDAGRPPYSDAVAYLDGEAGLIDAGRFATGDRLTIATWVKPEDEDTQFVFATGGPGENDHGIRLVLRPDKHSEALDLKVVFESSGAGMPGRVHSGVERIPLGEWSHLAVTLDASASVADLYINGRRVTTVDPDVPPLSPKLDTGLRGTDPKLADTLTEVTDLADELPVQPVPAKEKADELKNALKKLIIDLEDQRKLGLPGNVITNAIRDAQEAEEAIKGYADAADTPTDHSIAALDKLAEDTAHAAPDHEASPESDTPATLYERAKRLESQIQEAFTRGRAAEIMATTNTPAEEALAQAKPSKPERPGYEQALSKGKTNERPTVADVDRYRSTLDAVENEVAEIVSRAEAMRRQAPGNPNAASVARNVAANTGARSHGPGMMIDMTGVTSGATGSLQGGGGGTHSDIYRQDLSGEGAELELGPRRMPIGPLRPYQSLPGRRITDQALRKSWLFVGTWFVVGPWDNNSKIDFSQRHPPEAGIDLDAVYYDGKFADQPGHPDQAISWRFYQSDRSRCEPPRVYGASIYYWFTELYSDQDRNVIFAIGNDDAGRMWLNDTLIWQDQGYGDATGGFFQDIKGLRKVRLQRGYNKILMRLENGPINCHFRLIVMPPDAVSIAKSDE